MAYLGKPLILGQENEVGTNGPLPKIPKPGYREGKTPGWSALGPKKLGQGQVRFHTVFPDLTTVPGTQKAIKKYWLQTHMKKLMTTDEPDLHTFPSKVSRTHKVLAGKEYSMWNILPDVESGT